jgi:hypothetical protein
VDGGTVIVQLDFPHDYSAEALEQPGSERVVRIPASPEPVDSVYVRIEPQGGEPWIGAFARGFQSDDLVSGVYSWPDHKSVAVVSAGYGYVVKANDPTSWVRLQPMPVTDVRLMPEQKVIVFTDFTHMFAYNAEKNVWKSDRLSWDGITVTQVATNHIFGMAWDAMQDKEVEFVIDVRTGEHTGGAKPWSRR